MPAPFPADEVEIYLREVHTSLTRAYIRLGIPLCSRNDESAPWHKAASQAEADLASAIQNLNDALVKRPLDA